MKAIQNKQAVIVGIFVVIGVIILIGGIFTVGGKRKTFTKLGLLLFLFCPEVAHPLMF